MKMITLVAVAPMRAEAAHRSEMVSQLLFGELCECLETKGDFSRIKGNYDGYEGWVQTSQLAAIETGLFDKTILVQKSGMGGVYVNGDTIQLTPGAEVYLRAEAKDRLNTKELDLGIHTVKYSYHENEELKGETAEQVIHFARQFLGAPYLWGGKSIWGIDCSGLVQMAFKLAGVFVPRDAWQQAEGGDVVGFLQEAVQGDLAFFDNAEGRITHVGLLLNEQEILHASGVVRIDPIDNFGIIHRQTGKRTHNLRIIKRYF